MNSHFLSVSVKSTGFLYLFGWYIVWWILVSYLLSLSPADSHFFLLVTSLVDSLILFVRTNFGGFSFPIGWRKVCRIVHSFWMV